MSKGITSIKKSQLEFLKVTECENFINIKKGYKDVSDFEQAMLKLVGNAIRPANSQHFWCDGAYCWYCDERQEKKDSVWLTNNGIAMYEKETEDGNHELYRIRFNF